MLLKADNHEIPTRQKCGVKKRRDSRNGGRKGRHSFSGPLSAAREVSFPANLRNRHFPEDMISLYAGMPNPQTFPMAKLSVTLNDGTVLDIQVGHHFSSHFQPEPVCTCTYKTVICSLSQLRKEKIRSERLWPL